MTTMNFTGTGVATGRPAEKDSPTILVTTDGSDVALHAAELAVGLAGLLGAKLHVLYALDEDRAFRTGIHYGGSVRDLAVSGWRATGEVAALAEGADVEHEEVVVVGVPARVILSVADDVGADYIVMGANGASRLGHVLFGSVAEEVSRRADRSVILVGGKRARTEPLMAAPGH